MSKIISPPLGIGDILLWIMYFKSNNITDTIININKNLIKEYRLYPEKYINFIVFILESFNIKYNIVDSTIDSAIEGTIDRLNDYSFNLNYIYDFMNIDKDIPIEGNYIVFHTKARFDGYQFNFWNRDIQKIKKFLQTFKSNYTIVLLGEKDVEKCKEQQIHNIQSIYLELLELNNNNTVIDLTKDELYSGNDNIEDFVKDINIINNAKFNITFGYGGPLNLCQAFSKNNICYTGGLNCEGLNNYQNNSNSLYRDTRKFLNALNFINNPKCVVMCHLGLGDNITMNGLCRYLCQYYDEVHLPTKQHNYDNVSLIYKDEPKIKVFVSDINKLQLIPETYKNYDMYNTSIFYRINLKKRAVLNLQNYEAHHETENFIMKFYNRVNIPFKFYYEKFHISSTEKSLELYEKIKHYNIIFTHEVSSSKSFDIKNYLNEDENDIIICANRNYYTSTNSKKFELAQMFVNIPLIHYIDTIIHSNKILVCDSCFSSMIIPLKMKGIIKTDDITFFVRDNNDKLILELLPNVKCIK